MEETSPKLESQEAGRRWAATGFFVASALGLLTWFVVALVRAVPPPAPEVGPAATVLRVPRPIPDFSLTSDAGQPFDRETLIGHWSFLFFGYTYCPTICPMTLGVLREVRGRLAESEEGEALRDVQFAFVSVDPQRDTIGRLGSYLDYFDPALIGATGSEKDLAPLTQALGIYYQKVEDDSKKGYEVDHSSAIVLVDPEARLHAVFSDPRDPEEIAEAFRKMRSLEE